MPDEHRHWHRPCSPVRYKVHTCINCPCLTPVNLGIELFRHLSCELSKKSKSILSSDRLVRCNGAVLYHKQTGCTWAAHWRPAWNRLNRLCRTSIPLGVSAWGYKKKKRIIDTVFHPLVRDYFPVQPGCLTEVLYWGINRNQLKDGQKLAHSTVSLTTPIRLWGRSCSALWILLSAGWSSAVKVLRSPQLSRCSTPGCRLKGSTWALGDMACGAAAIIFKRKRKMQIRLVFTLFPLK